VLGAREAPLPAWRAGAAAALASGLGLVLACAFAGPRHAAAGAPLV
jgi:hypothetical protein